MNDMSSVLPFNQRISQFLRRIEYRRATDPQSLDEIYRLRYRGYLKDGGIGPNPTERFSDEWDDAPNAMVFGVYLNGELASTIRTHIARPGDGDMPALETFPDALADYVAAGRSMIDPTRFVIDAKFAPIGPEIPFLTLRLVAMAAEHYDVDVFLVTVREEHAVMYKRLCGHKAISEPRAYPLLAKKIVCMAVETQAMRRSMIERGLTVFESTARERERIFEPA